MKMEQTQEWLSTFFCSGKLTDSDKLSEVNESLIQSKQPSEAVTRQPKGEKAHIPNGSQSSEFVGPNKERI